MHVHLELLMAPAEPLRLHNMQVTKIKQTLLNTPLWNALIIHSLTEISRFAHP